MTSEIVDLDDVLHAKSRRDVRYALEILDECQGPREMANMLEAAICGVSTKENAMKLAAFTAGLGWLGGAPVPVPWSLVWGTT